MWFSKKTVKLPTFDLKAMSDNALETVRFTPDIAKLMQSEFQRVFIYNEMQFGHRSHVFLPEDLARRDAICYTDNHYTLWKKRLRGASQAVCFEGPGPWPRPEWNQANRARIQGEIYFVRSAHVPVLDTYHQNGVEFKRQRVRIVRPYRSTIVAKDGFPLNGEQLESFKARGIVHSMRACNVLECWMYVGIPEYWDNQLGRLFAPVQTYTSPNEGWLREYYSFTVLEYAR